MSRSVFILLLLICCSGWAFAQGLPPVLRYEISIQTNLSDGEHMIEISSKKYVIRIEQQEIKSIRRVVLPKGVRDIIDSPVADMIEEAYASHLLRIDDPRFENISVLEGEWEYLESVTDDDIEVKTSFQDDSFLVISISNKGNNLSIMCPVDYQLYNSGTRTEIENSFINELLLYDVKGGRMPPRFSYEDLNEIGDNLFVLPGERYILNSINRNAYISSNNNELDFIVNPIQPIATISNMIVVGVGYKATINLSIMRHEYGEKTIIQVPLEQFLQFCIANGCQVFWGIREYKDGVLSGTIFCHNVKQGYEHIVRIQCDTFDLGAESFSMVGKASLFIPTTNLLRQR